MHELSKGNTVYTKESLVDLGYTIDDISLVPDYGLLDSRSEAEVTPFIYSAPMESVTGYELARKLCYLNQYPVVSRFLSREERAQCYAELHKEENVFFSTGTEVAKTIEEIEYYIGHNYKINLALDIAHGDMKRAHDITSLLRSHSNIRYIMSGSICTKDAALTAVMKGKCTHLRVGVGNGSACTTRLQTGIGVPNACAVSYVKWGVDIAHLQGNQTDIHIIADGGIRYPGDAIKYLALGATGVMLGNLFAKCKESPGWGKYPIPGSSTKHYMGQASALFQENQYGKASACPEGAHMPLVYNGHTVENTVNMFTDGARSAISYLGLRRLKDINPDNVKIIRVTDAGIKEAQPHGLTTSYKI